VRDTVHNLVIKLTVFKHQFGIPILQFPLAQMGMTMKNMIFAALLAGGLPGGAALADDAMTEAALTELADTFARGFYARDPEMVLSTVHPELSKIGVTEDYWGSGIQIIEQLPPGTLQVLGSIYNYNNRLDPITSTVGVDFFESTESMGLLRLTADQDISMASGCSSIAPMADTA
jgi:hypothetical protein